MGFRVGYHVDYLIFRNMSKGDDSEDPIEIVLLDVKTGNAGLKPIQKKIEAAVSGKRISFDVLRVSESVTADIGATENGTRQLQLNVIPMKQIPLSYT